MKILSIDVGTSAVKSAILHVLSGDPVADVAKVPYELDNPAPDAFEIPPQRLRDAVWEAARKALAALPKGSGVEGIGLSCLMPAVVLLDKADVPLSPIWIHLDRRSRPLARAIQAEVGDDFLKSVGNRPLPGGISGLCYAQQVVEDPTLAGRVSHYLHANGWLAFLLTGERFFDTANASFTGLFDTLGTRDWSDRWCDLFGVRREWLPPVVCGSTTIGTLRDDIAADWGLPKGIPVKIGTADTSSAMLAARMKPGDLLHSVGTTQVLGTLVARPTPDPTRLTRFYGVGESYVYVAHNPVGGSALGWLHQLCFRDQSTETYFEKTVLECAKKASDVKLDPPFLGGDRLEIEPRRAAFRELTLGTDREDLLTALLVAMRQGHRSAFNAMDLKDQPDRRIVLTGGGSEIVRHLIPEYATARIDTIDEGAMRGVARLFD
jgi:xylulokinase